MTAFSRIRISKPFPTMHEFMNFFFDNVDHKNLIHIFTG